jgi:hypothetical protein
MSCEFTKVTNAAVSSDVANNAADLDVMLPEWLFNKPAADKSCSASHKYLFPALLPRKLYILGRRRIVCSRVPRLCERSTPATDIISTHMRKQSMVCETSPASVRARC